MKTFAAIVLSLAFGLGISRASSVATSAAAALSAETSCPASKIAPGNYSCSLLSPSDTGAAGENADVPSYALTPATDVAERGVLLLHLNGSGGSPAGQIADPADNFYLAAVHLGYHVIGLSYASNETLRALCGNSDSCYFPSRQTLILGVYQPGTAEDLRGILPSEGIADRLLLALEHLSQARPDDGWDSFLTGADASAPPEQRIAWTKIVVSGHSQGGGHAAAIGKLFPVARVIQLSATCDEAGGQPVSWLSFPGQTDPSRFWGLGSRTILTNGVPTGGDTLCFTHALSWQSEGMIEAHQNDDAETCGTTGNTHGVTIACAENLANWQKMLAPCIAKSTARCLTPLVPPALAPVDGRN